MNADASLAALLQHPALWRGSSAARIPTWPTGFAALDQRLPGGGWPKTGLIEILIPRLGCGELHLLLPALALASQGQQARWCVWIAPPLEPFAPALASEGLNLQRLLIVRAPTPLWALEQSLSSGACESVLAWTKQVHHQELRRLQLAAERGRSLGILFRALRSAREPSYATLRLALEPCPYGVRIDVLKSRGGPRGSLEINWRH